MADKITGDVVVRGQRFAILVSRFNEFVTTRLRDGAVDALQRQGYDSNQLTEVWVPGAFELPLAARRLAASGRFDAIIALGCVIRGETPHFDYVASAAATGLSRVALESGLPVGFGVLTTDTIEQAVERAGSKGGNKGAEAALSALEMTNLLARLNGV